MHYVLVGVFVFLRFSWAILSFGVMVDFVFNSALGLGEKSEREFCEPDPDADQCRLGSPILKHAGFRGAAHGGVDDAPHQNALYIFFFKFLQVLNALQRGKYKIDPSQKLRIS